MFPPLHPLRATLAAFARLALLVAAPLHAQMMRGEISVSAGVATDQRGFRSNAIPLSPSVVLAPDPRLTAGLVPTGPQFRSHARGPFGTAGAAARPSNSTGGGSETARDTARSRDALY